ncbi:hypothetical protein EDC04DRAFT_2610358 [Pisolithus marmoratus]|nr:hypothetical protein EDC04DRAFT_2610358 [Pisolithus marmoratus]
MSENFSWRMVHMMEVNLGTKKKHLKRNGVDRKTLEHLPIANQKDWTQVPDVDLEVHTSNLEGTERAKEVEKSCWEAAKKEHRVEEWERQECEEQERWAHEEHEEKERWAAIKAACQAVVAEAEGAWQSVTKEKGQGGTDAKTGSLQRLQAKGGGSWATAEEAKAVAGPLRKRAGTGSLQGEGRKKGWPDKGNDDDDDDDEARIVAATEQLALAMEVQARAIQAYVRHVMALPPWPQEVQAGVVPGGVSLVAEGSWSGVEWSESAVSRVAEEGGEQNKEDAEGDVEDMQE